MPVIGITREMGSLGKDVAAGVAERLGLRLVYNELTDALANDLHVEPSAVGRMIDGQATLSDRFRLKPSDVGLFTEQEVLDTALKGNVVFRGWGATNLLRLVPHIPCIRVSAPLEVRVRHMMERLRTDDHDKVLHEIRRNDAAHADTVRRLFGVSYEDPWLYDATFNTEKTSVDFCIDRIVGMVNHADFAETAESRALLKQMALKSHIRTALRKTPATAELGVTLAVNDGRVVIEGIVDTEEQRNVVDKVVGRVPGVTGTDNQLRCMSSRRTRAQMDG
ncbi:MAG: cytidylate kinase family protein [Burkholderiaceae bacterium]